MAANILRLNYEGCALTPDDFSKICDLIPDGLMLVSGDGRTLGVNAAAARRFGSTVDAMVDRKFGDIVDGNDGEVSSFLRQCRRSPDEVVAAFKLCDSQQPTRFFGRLASRGSEPSQSILLLRIPDEDAAVNRFSILNEKIDELSHEITRRHALELELREQRDLAAFGRDIGLALAEALTIDGMLAECAEILVRHLGAAFARIWIVDTAGEALELRASAGQYTHLDGPHSRIMIGQFKIGMIAQEKKAHLTNEVIGDDRVHDQAWARREQMVAFAGYPLIVDGETIGVMAIFARHRLTEGSLNAMASVANSIALGAERKRIESSLKEHAEMLQVADRRKDEFLAMLAHELRNPLAPIRSGLELIEQESGEDETLTVMKEQVHHLSRLVDDLLDVSRIMRGKIDLRTDVVDLVEIIERAARTAMPAIDRHRHKFSVSKPDSSVWIEGDEVRMGQVVTNLLNNAAKYTPDGGVIELAVSADENDALVIVRDNGVGIDADFLPEMFDLFAQAHRELARSEGGLGIGLTLARRLVDLHGGEISVRSQGVGHGSEFTIRLRHVHPPQAADGPEQSDGAVPNHRVLVVDDSVGSARILRRLLGAIGISDVELAYDGPSAIEMAKGFRPDVIFLDIGLPCLSGFEVAERLRADSQFQSTRLIALTGYGTEEDRRKSQACGFDEHLVKPVSLDQLKTVLVEDVC